MEIFIQISYLLLVVLGVSFIMRLLKQPLIIGYIFSGILVGPLIFNLIPQTEVLDVFSDIGIAFLLFIVGLHLSPKVIKEVGKISLITGVGQVVFTSIGGYFIGMALGFSFITSLYVAVALTFSSTIIIMKLLSDKDALEKLYGKISIGFLLVQDLIAIIILIVVSSFSGDTGLSATSVIFSTLVKGTLIILILAPLGYFVFPKLNKFFSHSQEFLFLFAISFGLGLSSLFHILGFSIEVGALIAGIALSTTPYSYEVSSKLKPLRDFFIISFFLILGSQMIFTEISRFIFPIVIFSLFILIGNPLIVMVLMGLMGYSKRVGFMAGLTVAQISEFSLILIALGVRVGHLPNEILSFVTVVGLVTIAGSTYMIMYSENFYLLLAKPLSIFEKNKVKDKLAREKNFDYFLLGYNRIGFSILRSFLKLRKNYVIVDFNPETIKVLSSRKINCIYGDVDDAEFLEEIKLNKAKLLVSTIPELDTNLLLLKFIRDNNRKAVVILTARQIPDALRLYKEGADYVVLPHFLGGEYLSKIIEKASVNKEVYDSEKKKQIKDLNERIQEGHKHPEVGKN